MPTKKTEAGREYDVSGKKFTWHPLDDDDQTGTIPDVKIPLRLKLGSLRKLSGQDVNNVDTMFALLQEVVPGQEDTLDLMDVSDFVAMFETWQFEYNALSGATPGE